MAHPKTLLCVSLLLLLSLGVMGCGHSSRRDPPRDHGDTLGTATPIGVRTAVTGSFNTAGDVDYFEVTLIGDTNPDVWVNVQTQNLANGADTVVSFYDDQFRLLNTNDNHPNASQPLASGLSEPIPGPSSETYYIEVTDANGAAGGTYELYVDQVIR